MDSDDSDDEGPPMTQVEHPERPNPPAPRRRRRLLDHALGVDTLLTVALLGGFALLRLRNPIGDPDLGWHLAAGRYILDHLALPQVDHFSYVADGRPWIVYSWLAEVVLAGCERVFDAGGLIAAAALLIGIAFGTLLLTCRVAGARHTVAVIATFLAALVSAATWSVRPHLFSFVFLALFGLIIAVDRRREANGRGAQLGPHLWLLIPSTILWVNTHLFFLFGFAILGLDVLARWRVWLWNPEAGGVRRARCGLLVAIAAATLVNPYGWSLHTHLLSLGSDHVTFAMVTELQTPSLHHLHGQLLTGFFFWTVLVLILSPARKDRFELASVLLFAALAYAMARNMPFFAIVAAPVFARHMDALLPQRPTVVQHALSPLRRGVHAVVLGSCGILFAIGVRGTPASTPEVAVSHTRYPVEAVAFLNAQPAIGRLFNHFNWGGYLIENLYPHYRVSMDGRTGVYGPELLREYRATQYLTANWRDFLDRCDPDVVLWRKGDPFIRGLELLPEWRRLYEDEVAMIFVRERPASAIRNGTADDVRTPAEPPASVDSTAHTSPAVT